MMRKEIIACLILLLSTGCSTNNDDKVITEPGGKAEYFINNQTEKDIIIFYRKSEALGSDIDTTNIIAGKSSLKIFEDAMIGQNPVPENSIQEIKFYGATDLTEPLLILSPVENEDWIITDQDLGNSGYGLTIYEITFTDDLKTENGLSRK